MREVSIEEMLVAAGFLLLICAVSMADSNGWWWLCPAIGGIIEVIAGAVIHSKKRR